MKVGAHHIVEIPTGGNPVAALAAAVQQFLDGPNFVRVSVAHDEGCPCTSGAAMGACTCEIVELVGTRLA